MCVRHISLLCAAVFLGTLAVAATAAGQEPIVYYPFDELGNTIVDASGNGNDGMPNGGVQFEPAGYAKGCFSFNGSDSYVELDRPIQDDFTIMAWIKTDTEGLAGTQAYQGSGLFWSDVGGVANDFVIAILGTKFSFFAGNPDTSVTSNGDVVTGEWIHVAAVRDTGAGTISVYLDGALDNSINHSNTGPLDAQQVFVIGSNTLDQRFYTGLVDEVKIFDVALVEAEVQTAMRVGAAIASDPVPATELVDIVRDVVLSWTAGEFAQTHDVYFGTVFDDVNNASRDNPLGVLLSQDQSENTFDPEGLLEFGTTYYWRIDEVNGAPDFAIFKGDVWSFTAEPLAYPIENIIATSNAISDAGTGPENTVNGSGLDEADQHSTIGSDMWLGLPGGADPVYLQYDFGRVYKMHEMLVWNYNVQFELLLGFGPKDVTVEYSENGADWAALGDVVFAQATARPAYAANTTVDFQGVAAQHVRLTINSGYGMTGQYGLSEVRLLYIPAHAREPQPADGAVGVGVDADLAWRAGRDATTHEVYFGTDAGALELAGTPTDATLDPGALDLDTAYYWKVDETSDAVWEGDLWTFVTQEYLVVDDFESYDDEENPIYETWIDGFTNETGSTVGYFEAPFAEQTIVNSGRQSMPLSYDNTAVATSEAEFDLDQDWTAGGAQILSIAFAGAGDNAPAQLYAVINGNRVDFGGDASALAGAAWQVWNIDLSTVGGNLRNVTSLTIGIEGAGATGIVYIDDIRLYPGTSESITPADPGVANLVAHYALDGNANDSSGNGHDGTPVGNVSFVNDPARGQVVSLPGGDDQYISIEGVGISGNMPRTIACWAKADSTSIPDWTLIFGFTGTADAQGGNGSHFNIGSLGGPGGVGAHCWGWEETIFSDEQALEWHHYAMTYDGTTILYYGDGILQDTDVAKSNVQDLAISSDRVHIGSRITQTSSFPGSVDDARIYDRMLTEEEVAWLAGRRLPIQKPL